MGSVGQGNSVSPSKTRFFVEAIRVYKTINPDREQDEFGKDKGSNDEVADR